MGTLQVKVLETTGGEGRLQLRGCWFGVISGAVTMETACLLPDGDGVSRASSDVPATVQSGRILKGPPGAGDDTAGCPQELGHITAGWTDRQAGRQTVRYSASHGGCV